MSLIQYLDQYALELNFKHVINDPNSIEVKNPSFEISGKALWSKQYYDSTGVALLGKKVHGLTNFSVRNGSPEDYLNDMLSQLRLAGENQLVAVAIEGNSIYFNRIREFLDSEHIPMDDSYCEISNERKDLVIMPTTREVIIYSRALAEHGDGYIKLA